MTAIINQRGAASGYQSPTQSLTVIVCVQPAYYVLKSWRIYLTARCCLQCQRCAGRGQIKHVGVCRELWAPARVGISNFGEREAQTGAILLLFRCGSSLAR